jgi:hypothetical protein
MDRISIACFVVRNGFFSHSRNRISFDSRGESDRGIILISSSVNYSFRNIDDHL